MRIIGHENIIWEMSKLLAVILCPRSISHPTHQIRLCQTRIFIHSSFFYPFPYYNWAQMLNYFWASTTHIVVSPKLLFEWPCVAMYCDHFNAFRWIYIDMSDVPQHRFIANKAICQNRIFCKESGFVLLTQKSALVSVLLLSWPLHWTINNFWFDFFFHLYFSGNSGQYSLAGARESQSNDCLQFNISIFVLRIAQCQQSTQMVSS